jgi:DHA1 family tetracycline resistance protein-like MFS transporter
MDVETTTLDPETIEPTLPPPGNHALTFIFITVALDMIAFGIVAPVFPKLVINFVGGDNARAAWVFGVFATSFSLMQFFFSPIFGVLSDKVGRKPVIVLSTLGLGLDYIVMALAPNLAWLFAGRIVSGITSSNQTTASAYIADSVAPEKRAAAFGMIGAAFGLGFIVGPAIGGVLGAINPRYPFWFAAALSITSSLYGAFVLPESLPRERRRDFQWSRANPVAALRLLRSHRELFGLSAVFFLSMVAGIVMPAVWVLYADYRYGWNERTIGFSLAAVGLCSVLIQAALVKPIVKRLGNRRAIVWSFAAAAAGLIIFGLAPNGLIFFLGIPVMMFWGVATGPAQSLMTQRVSPSEQGELQGAIGSLRGIASLIGPAIFTGTFALFVGALRPLNLPGAPWFLAAALLLAAVVVTLKVTAPEPRAEVKTAAAG